MITIEKSSRIFVFFIGMLAVLAIAAGGVITHSLVPPTPGPLVMADNLGIDIGVMILVGALVAFPSANVSNRLERNEI